MVSRLHQWIPATWSYSDIFDYMLVNTNNVALQNYKYIIAFNFEICGRPLSTHSFTDFHQFMGNKIFGYQFSADNVAIWSEQQIALITPQCADIWDVR